MLQGEEGCTSAETTSFPSPPPTPPPRLFSPSVTCLVVFHFLALLHHLMWDGWSLQRRLAPRVLCHPEGWGRAKGRVDRMDPVRPREAEVRSNLSRRQPATQRSDFECGSREYCLSEASINQPQPLNQRSKVNEVLTLDRQEIRQMLLEMKIE